MTDAAWSKILSDVNSANSSDDYDALGLSPSEAQHFASCKTRALSGQLTDLEEMNSPPKWEAGTIKSVLNKLKAPISKIESLR